MHRIRRKTDELKSRESKHPQDEEVSLPFYRESAAGHPYRYCSYGTGSKQYGHNCYNRRSGKFRNVEIDPGGGYNIRRKHWNHNNSPAHVFRLTNFSYIIIGLGLLIAFFSKRRTLQTWAGHLPALASCLQGSTY